MNFQSLQFLLFLAVVVAGNWALRRRDGGRKNFLLLASAVFYASWDWRFLGLVAALAGVNFVAGARIAAAASERVRRAWLALSLTASLGTLACFKYADFFMQSFVQLAAAVGVHVDVPVLRLILPLGISFYTFQSLSYVLDVYRRQEQPCTSMRDFLLFVAFFPTVLAGPITRARHLLPQFERPSPLDGGCLEHGLALIVRGFVKKLVFADVLGGWIVSPAFSQPEQYAPLFLLLGLYAYTFQIYMDVSAYTDIARGSARMCGFHLPRNFDRPYIASTVSNFWQRWHMSMSGFFRDYLFFSLGGSRHGNVYLNLMITFVAIGFWHGAGWNFIVYGLVHGAVVCIERWLRMRRDQRGESEPEPGSWRHLWGIALTFHIVVFSRVLFRAEDLSSAGRYLAAMLPGGARPAPLGGMALLSLLGAAVLHWALPDAGRRALLAYKAMPAWSQALVLVMLAYAGIALSSGGAPFVYFQF